MDDKQKLRPVRGRRSIGHGESEGERVNHIRLNRKLNDKTERREKEGSRKRLFVVLL